MESIKKMFKRDKPQAKEPYGPWFPNVRFEHGRVVSVEPGSYGCSGNWNTDSDCFGVIIQGNTVIKFGPHDKITNMLLMRGK